MRGKLLNLQNPSMVFSKFLDGLLKIWRENPITASARSSQRFFRILRDLSVLGGEKLDFENAMKTQDQVIDAPGG